MTGEFLRAEGLTKVFPVKAAFGRKARPVTAVDRVDLALGRGETLAVVGESGSGKTTLGRCLLGMETPTAGRVRLGDEDLTGLRGRQRRRLQSQMQVVFQDPYSSLNPHLTALQLVAEPLELLVGKDEAADRALAALEAVGIGPADVHRYPATFSGGQRQRIGIARAISVRPAFVFCDEPVSSLDLSVQARVLRLLADLRAELGLTYLFVSHDLSVVRDIATRTAVMQAGRLVEVGPTATIFEHPAHPYTRALLAAIPLPDPRQAARRRAERMALRAAGPPSGDPLPRHGDLAEVAPGHWVASGWGSEEEQR